MDIVIILSNLKSESRKINLSPFNVSERSAYLTQKYCGTSGLKYPTQMSVYKLIICKVTICLGKKVHCAQGRNLCILWVMSAEYMFCIVCVCHTGHWSVEISVQSTEQSVDTAVIKQTVTGNRKQSYYSWGLKVGILVKRF
jgi:hypothetical protein